MKTLANRFRFFLEHAGYCTPPGRAVCAMALARAEERAETEGLSVTWEDDDLPWDGDCPAPAILQYACVYEPCDDADPPYRRSILAGLGGIGLASWRDPYVRVVEAELFSEALDALDAERDAESSEMARELASRATYAGPVLS